MRKATTPKITRAPSKPVVTPKPITPPPVAKSKLISRPKPKVAPKPAPAVKPIETPLLGTLVVAAPAPAVAATNGPLNQIPPESPAPPPAETVILPSSEDKKASGYAVVESEAAQPIVTVAPVSEDAAKLPAYRVVESEATPPVITDAVPTGYVVVESDSTPEPSPEPSTAVPPPAPAVPTVMIPAGQAMEEISSIQIGDVLIIAVKVQPKQEPEAIG